MKYILVDDRGTDIFYADFETAAEAINFARLEWSRLSNHDKHKRAGFYVTEVDETGIDPEDICPEWNGDIVWEAKINA